ncbi:hypothetical protein IW262DRAFT_1447828 [Armillaria fumosa]|nr:hypothetical protein IW262DRAFT_1447828 [Armillaria fumosa]
MQHDTNARHWYGSPDSLVSAEDPFLHISNFSDTPIIISKGQVVGHAHNPRNWLDHRDRSLEAKDTYAHLVKTLGSNAAAHQIQSETTVTSKAQRNATEADDPVAQPPVEGGPKTAEVPKENITTGQLFDELDLSPDLSETQQTRLCQVIQTNRLAFGLDGRLGTNNARVEIKLKPGAQPVSLPPFPINKWIHGFNSVS